MQTLLQRYQTPRNLNTLVSHLVQMSFSEVRPPYTKIAELKASTIFSNSAFPMTSNWMSMLNDAIVSRHITTGRITFEIFNFQNAEI